VGANTATVETLTAEVRVLMVGSRQITLSVARQLDVVSLWDINAWNRVRLGRDRDRFVIGRRAGSTDLVLAEYDSLDNIHVLRAKDIGLWGYCTQYYPCGGVITTRIDDARLTMDGRIGVICDVEAHPGQVPCDQKLWIEDFQRALQFIDLHRKAAHLPLVVLAGLR
jgi:hypothetical protein